MAEDILEQYYLIRLNRSMTTSVMMFVVMTELLSDLEDAATQATKQTLLYVNLSDLYPGCIMYTPTFASVMSQT
jgi:hypothetical protein